MKERERFLWQLILQLIPSFIPAALAVIIGFYKDAFPFWAFLTLMIILSLFLIIALFRLVLGDISTQLWRNWKRTRVNSQHRKLALLWKEHWDSLCNLFNKCVDQPKPPSKKQESEFYELHKWFVNNRASFLPIWESFRYRRYGADHEDWGRYDPRTKILDEHAYDPFSVIYQAPSLKDAIISWGVLEGGVDHWLNEYQDKSPFKHALEILRERLDELLSLG